MNRGTRTLIVIAIAVAIASLASFGIYRAVQQIPIREVEVASVYAVVATRDLGTGTLLTPADVELVPWPAASPVAGSFDRVEAVVDRGLIGPIQQNEIITESKLAPVGTGAGLPPSILPGMRAISVRVNDVVGVAGFVTPGTRVDVVATLPQGTAGGMSRAIVNNVQVLASGQRLDQDRGQGAQPVTTTVVTLLVTPDDAERIALASNEGQLLLTLRNPLDTDPTETKGIRLASLMGEPDPPPVRRVVRGVPRVVQAPPPAPSVYTVEAIRGGDKRTEEVR